MISITIFINGKPLLARSASRVKGEDWEVCDYKVDDGTIVRHQPDEGPVALAKKLLDTIKAEGEKE